VHCAKPLTSSLRSLTYLSRLFIEFTPAATREIKILKNPSFRRSTASSGKNNILQKASVQMQSKNGEKCLHAESR